MQHENSESLLHVVVDKCSDGKMLITLINVGFVGLAMKESRKETSPKNVKKVERSSWEKKEEKTPRCWPLDPPLLTC